MKNVIIVFAIFLNFASLQNHNSEKPLITQEYTNYLKSTVDWEVTNYEENIFKGWTLSDFYSLMGQPNASQEIYTESDILNFEIQEIKEFPKEINRSEDPCTHNVKDQGGCDACWAFASVGTLSDNCCRTNSNKGWLSVQEILSCNDRNMDCISGNLEESLKYSQIYGLVQEACYPYIAKSETCPTQCKDGQTWANAHVCKCKTRVNCGKDPNSWKSCLANGAIMVPMMVYDDLIAYKSGIYCWNQQGKMIGPHEVRCTGYGESYLTCANDWGEKWGEKGFFNIGIDKKCGLSYSLYSWSCFEFENFSARIKPSGIMISLIFTILMIILI